MLTAVKEARSGQATLVRLGRWESARLRARKWECGDETSQRVLEWGRIYPFWYLQQEPTRTFGAVTQPGALAYVVCR